MSEAFPLWAEERRAALESTLEGLFEEAWPAKLREICLYPILNGGKRIRPLLVFASHEALRGPSLPPLLLHAAAALELIHCYSLVHDDLPCMDDDHERRGKPTLHVLYGEAPALLAGDALLTEAFSLLSRADAPAELRVRLLQTLSEAAGYRGMIGGQAVDIGLGGGVADVDTLTRLHQLKTGALFRAAVRMGALCAGATEDQLSALDRYAQTIGLAFQLADDVLDEAEDASEDGPPSFVKLLGAEATRRRAAELSREGQEALRGLSAHRLLEIAAYAVQRSH